VEEAFGKAALGFCGLAPGYAPLGGRTSRVRGALGIRVLTRLAAHAMTMRGFPHASRGPLSLLAGNRAKTPGALGYTGRPCLGGDPGRQRAELEFS
jgi:hypothetical protein